MTYLLDTVVLSEIRKPRPDARVAKWVDSQDWENLYISAMTIGEIRAGVVLARTPEREEALDQWVAFVREEMRDRILPVGPDEAEAWGRIHARRSAAGAMPAFVDSLIAATAVVRNLTVVTRNVKDFEPTGVPVLNPWEPT